MEVVGETGVVEAALHEVSQLRQGRAKEKGLVRLPGRGGRVAEQEAKRGSEGEGYWVASEPPGQLGPA